MEQSIRTFRKSDDIEYNDWTNNNIDILNHKLIWIKIIKWSSDLSDLSDPTFW